VIGLVISLVMLAVLGCFMGAFFLRRARRRRREREQTSTQDDTARMWDRKAKHESTGNYEEKERNIPSPVASLDSRASLTPSAVSQIRARTPGGTPAVPVPYNPSEISDDVSAHFAMLTPDHKIGVPVPYPLALHVPSRVQQAMLERDERWQQYELLRQNQSRTDDHSETSTIPRPLSRLPQRRSTLRSMTSGVASSSEAYTGMDSRRNSRRSTWENEPYSVSEVDRSRSEVATNDHRGAPSTRSSMISNLTSPPLPSLQSHRSDGSYASMIRVRRLPPLPGQRTSNDGFPFTTSTESPSESENPFNTDPTVNISGMNNISEEPSSPESHEGSREITTEHRSEEWSAPIVSSVTGVARTASARTVHYLGRSPSNGFGPRLPSSQNPFDDNPSRFSAADSIGETIDAHQIRGMINTFPTPPDSPRRLE
jgi:type II secretory pathway pseudopilin PulG